LATIHARDIGGGAHRRHEHNRTRRQAEEHEIRGPIRLYFRSLARSRESWAYSEIETRSGNRKQQLQTMMRCSE